MSQYSKIKTIVIDDQRTMVQIITSLLKDIGFRDIDEALDGVTAYEKLSKGGYQLVISDWNMEPVTGYQLLKKVRASEPPLKNIPFILVTAESKTENIIAAKKAGVNNYIVKPFTAKTLKQKINAVLGIIG